MSNWNSHIYEKLLLLCPDDLRRDFGTEMTMVFTEEFADSWQEAGIFGAIGVWWRALCDLLRIIFSESEVNPYIVVPGVSFLLSSLLLCAELALARKQAGFVLNDSILTLVLWPCIASASISIAAVHTCRVRVTVGLHLVSVKK